MKRFVAVALCLSALMILASCSVSERSLKNAEKRINTLLQRGVPDSSLSRAKVFLYQARDAVQRENHGLARSSADSMRVLIAQAEEKYARDMERLKPYLANLRAKAQQTRNEISGLHAKRLDSLLRRVDSLTQINWLIAAEAEANKVDSLLPRFKFEQQRADELRTRVTGSWVCSNKITHDVDKTVNAVEKKIFTFNPDGKATLVENKQGKSSPFLKEDWEFRSWGTWDLYGDTVCMFVNRFACTRQNFEEYHNNNGKITWDKKVDPTYDSTITDHSQDRWISYTDLTTDFKHE
jgi:hypothetical protein